jgi:hypothetical protein
VSVAIRLALYITSKYNAQRYLCEARQFKFSNPFYGCISYEMRLESEGEEKEVRKKREV